MADTSHHFPRASRIEELAGRTFFRALGWRVEGKLPEGVERAVLIAAPHTTNWDLPFMLATASVFRVRLSFLAKHTVFKGVAGPLMRWLGGIPVDRRARHGMVGEAARRLLDTTGMLLAVAPAGTRSRAKHWKSGFYRIAEKANVPIVCGFLDFENRVAGVGPAIVPSGDIIADMNKIRAFYAGMRGLRPEKNTPIRLRAELERDRVSSRA